MRLWSLHPKYLDRQGLLAAWREGLLAQAVLAGRTRGYREHPQLHRFRAARDPEDAICAYLAGIAAEAARRGYRFNTELIGRPGTVAELTVTTGQLAHERTHLAAKLTARSPDLLPQLPLHIEPHPIFAEVDGPVEPWERP